jgi:DNA repair protein RadD
MNYKLRAYQEKGLKDALDYISSNDDKYALMVAPTGAGKSLYIASILNAIKGKSIILQPNKELLEQNFEKYISYGNEASIYSASLGSKELGHVTFATIGSIKKEASNLQDVELIIVDEAHLQSKKGSAMSSFFEAVKPKKVIGLTATPIELRDGIDGSYLCMINRSRNNIFEQIIHCTQIQEIVKGGFWSNIVYDLISTDKSKLELNSKGTDFTEKSLIDFYKKNNLDGMIVDKIKALKKQGRKHILVFVPSIADAENLTSKIKGSACISSNTEKKERTYIIENFKNGNISVVFNVNILSVGFDFPQLDTIIMARPTNSFAIYYQQCGRGVRPHKDKKNTLIVDMSGNIESFGKLENIEFKNGGGNKWGMFVDGRQLTSGKVLSVEEGKFWFGKYKGEKYEDVNEGYLRWVVENWDIKDTKSEKMIRKLKEILKTKKHLR